MPTSLTDPTNQRSERTSATCSNASAKRRHLEEPVGELRVVLSPDRPLGRNDRRVMADLVAQAGPAVLAVALHAELTRRLEQLTEQSAELLRSRCRLDTEPATARAELRRADDLLRESLDEIRELSRGLHPPCSRRAD